MPTVNPFDDGRRISVERGPVTPTLFTLERARARGTVGHTHRIDDPYTQRGRFTLPEPVVAKGMAVHTARFSCNIIKKKSLVDKFQPSIVTDLGGLTVTEGMFKPYLIPPLKKPKKDDDDDAKSDNTDNTIVRAYKKQQAHVEALYWHEGAAGQSSARECSCVYGEGRHYHKQKRVRYYSGHRRTKAAKEIWARLTRPKSSPQLNKKR